MIRKNVMLTDIQVEAVKKEAIRRGISYSEMHRKILDKWIEGNIARVKTMKVRNALDDFY